MFDRKIKIAKTPQEITESNYTARENNSLQNEHYNLVKNYTENPSTVLTQIPSDTFTEDMNPNVLKSIDIMNSIDNNDYWVIDTNNCIYTTITNQDNSTFEFLTTLAISSLKKYTKDTGFDIKKVFVENIGIYSKIILKDFKIDIIKNGSYDGVVTLPDIKVTSDSFFYENDTKSFGKTKYELLKDVVVKKENSYILLLNNTFYECLPFGGSNDLSYIVNYTDNGDIDITNEMFIDEKGIMNFNYTNNTMYSSYYNTSGIKLNEILKPDDNIVKENSISIGFNGCEFLSDFSSNGYANIQFHTKDEYFDGSLKRFDTIIHSAGLITTINEVPRVIIDHFGLSVRGGELSSPKISSPYITGGITSNFDTLNPTDYITKAYVDYTLVSGNSFDYTLQSYKYNQTNDTNNFFEIKYNSNYVDSIFNDAKYNIIFRDEINNITTILNKKGLYINLTSDIYNNTYTEVSVNKIGIYRQSMLGGFGAGSLLTDTDLKIGINEDDTITIRKDSIVGSPTIKDYTTLQDKNYIQKKHLEDKIAELVATGGTGIKQRIPVIVQIPIIAQTLNANSISNIRFGTPFITGGLLATDYPVNQYLVVINSLQIQLRNTEYSAINFSCSILADFVDNNGNPVANGTKYYQVMLRRASSPNDIIDVTHDIKTDTTSRADGSLVFVDSFSRGPNDPFTTDGILLSLDNQTTNKFSIIETRTGYVKPSCLRIKFS